jgi:ribosomal protein S18 acetylase RimI-like enzyme
VRQIEIRRALKDDLVAMVRLLADDELGATRELADGGAPAAAYRDAFVAIDADPRELLLVAETSGTVVAMLQLTFIRQLTHQGGERCQLESVRVRSALRGEGIGKQLVQHAVAIARVRGCRLVQLTTDKRRGDVRRFYESLGFQPSHEGLKLDLASTPPPDSSVPQPRTP